MSQVANMAEAKLSRIQYEPKKNSSFDLLVDNLASVMHIIF